MYKESWRESKHINMKCGETKVSSSEYEKEIQFGVKMGKTKRKQEPSIWFPEDT